MSQKQSTRIFAAILCTMGTGDPHAHAQRRTRANGAGPRGPGAHVVLPSIQVRSMIHQESEAITSAAPEAAIVPFRSPTSFAPASRLQLIASYDGTPTTVQVRVSSGMGILRNYDDVAPVNVPSEIAIDCVVEPPTGDGSTVVLAALTIVGRSTR